MCIVTIGRCARVAATWQWLLIAAERVAVAVLISGAPLVAANDRQRGASGGERSCRGSGAAVVVVVLVVDEQ